MRERRTFHSIAATGIVIGLFCAPFLLTYTADGQTPRKDPENPQAAAASAQGDPDPVAFERWVVKTCEEVSAARREPSAISDAILNRLKNGAFVTDKAVMYGIGAWTFYDSQATKLGSAKNRYNRTIAMIDKMSALLDGRPWLKAQLGMRKAGLYSLDERTAEAIAVRRTANTELDSLYEEISTHYIDNMTILGGLLYSQGKKKEAEKVFLDVLSFPWYLTKSPTLQVLRDRYVQAGRGVIDCRRGDLHALQGTYFVPASLNELGPYLDRALVEAGGKPRE